MNLQYILDNQGNTTGVFIPIEQWDALKDKYQIEQENPSIPQWQQDEVLKRLEAYKADPSQVEDFDKAMDEIEQDL